MKLPLRTQQNSVPGQNAGVPLVSVVMPVRNEAAFLHRSLTAVLAQDYPAGRFEVIVADGMSTDGTREVVAQIMSTHPNVKLVDNPEQIVATGLNRSLRLVKGDIVIRVDGHCEIAADYVRRCVEHLGKDAVEAVGGPLETVGESYVARAIALAMSSWFGVGGSAFRVAGGESQFTDTVAFPAYTRAAIERAGPFDEELVRNQDDEYNYRLRKLGMRILLAADVHSRYYSRATLGGLCRQYFQYGFWKVRVMQKHWRQMRARQFAPAGLIAVLGLAIVAAIFLPGVRLAPALIAGLYASVTGLAAVLSIRRTELGLLPVLPLAFAALHLSYGLGFWFGLVRFWSRWRDGDRPLAAAAAIQGEQA